MLGRDYMININKTRRWAYKIDSSVWLNRFWAIFQVLAGISAYLFTICQNKWFLYIALGLLSVVLITLVIRAFSKQIGIIKFRLLDNGLLLDEETGFENVSFRKESVKIMLTKIYNPEGGIVDEAKGELRVYNTGLEVGKDFFGDYIKYLLRKGKKLQEMSLKKKLEGWIEYDSSSGMGTFSIAFPYKPKRILKVIPISDYSGLSIQDIKVEIKTSCTGKIKEFAACRFLSGYIAGFCSELTGSQLEVTEYSCYKTTPHKDICVFEVLR